MIVVNKRCVHCKDVYRYHYSGSYIPRHNDSDYCPICMKTIETALESVPPKRIKKSIETDEVDLKTLKQWEKDTIQEYEKKTSNDEIKFPLMKQVFSKLYNWEKEEHEVVERVNGRDEHKNKVFYYSYWPSNKIESLKITVEKEFNAETMEEIGYWKYYK